MTTPPDSVEAMVKRLDVWGLSTMLRSQAQAIAALQGRVGELEHQRADLLRERAALSQENV